ncbi:MAG: tetratricopeptide repeat protein [Chloroflexi bacterium]|nr:tetratricopeptide repeat protein [Chloroflexota bacterium]
MTTTTTGSTSYHTLVGNALQLLGAGLGPYISVRLRAAAGRGHYVPDDVDTFGDVEGDVAVMLRVMAAGWNEIFRDHLGPVERSLVSEIRETRNRWAHMESFSEDDLDRALDSIGRLLTAVGAHVEGNRVDQAKHRLRRRRYGSDQTAAASVGERPEPGVVAPEPERRSTEPAPPVAMPPTPGVDGGARMETLVKEGISCRQQGNFQMAIASFGKAISINREHPDPWYHRALTWGHMGQFERAINDFNRVISLDNSFADAYNGRGYAQFCLGDDPKAIADFEEAINLAPDDELTRANLEKARKRWAERGGGY